MLQILYFRFGFVFGEVIISLYYQGMPDYKSSNGVSMQLRIKYSRYSFSVYRDIAFCPASLIDKILINVEIFHVLTKPRKFFVHFYCIFRFFSEEKIPNTFVSLHPLSNS